MVKYLVKRKMKNGVDIKNKKALVYTGGVLVGVGGYFAYKAIKNKRMNKNFNCCNDYKNESYYYDDYDSRAYCCDEDMDNFDDDLKCKVDEFNSNRIIEENCTNVSKEELEGYVNKAIEEREHEEREENKHRPGVGIHYDDIKH
ncbi:hypothetical protein [Romboutsia sp. 1001216sp1]|uniref:hypothetical protein n=1 Tax=Romboutsia sp. 1001216sp1 TaxID=2986997 RepID=UPI00232C56F5|nr:hypothetical protein [Romboutsia sp. 1001216sp1]MDB8804264.1 hypothetical protein [Romboutsia sp. 1001216sp1]MDB8807778.1 hypothetical protein [Romboutsia sp. 1001216sp1]MDB8809910.1 hypothetical protein [Romboutsia sp. 1001216sp1]MDB8815660.1 hypothetical protein [Romboutsia sp. 1001216sp1]MDB8819492.1 hypothetical protein [Romboutsia sp. 1001216sp1]